MYDVVRADERAALRRRRVLLRPSRVLLVTISSTQSRDLYSDISTLHLRTQRPSLCWCATILLSQTLLSYIATVFGLVRDSCFQLCAGAKPKRGPVPAPESACNRRPAQFRPLCAMTYGWLRPSGFCCCVFISQYCCFMLTIYVASTGVRFAGIHHERHRPPPLAASDRLDRGQRSWLG